MDLRQPWDFQSDLDTRETYPLFRQWLDLDAARPNSPAAFAGQWGMSQEEVLDLSSRGRWLSRAWAYDRAWAGQRAAEERAMVKDWRTIEKAWLAESETTAQVKDRHKENLKLLHRLCNNEIRKFLLASEQSSMHGLLTPREIIRLADILVKNERLVNGEATERIEGQGPDLSRLSEVELWQYRALAMKASGMGGG